MNGNQCSECGSKKNLQVHHLNYRSNGGDNSPDNLKLLCKSCHIKTHSLAGDFSRWGSLGGLKTCQKLSESGVPLYMYNLKQYREKLHIIDPAYTKDVYAE